MPPSRSDINVSLVRQLIAEQFPQWADLPIVPVEPDGWDNRTFRLGQDLSVRLPSAAGYAAQVEKEHRWLPRLAPHLPLPIPVPLAMGLPAPHYPWPWSVYRWLDGETATLERIRDERRFAADLAQFLVALQQIDPAGGPPPGAHNFFRGAPPAVYDGETRQAIATLDGEIDARTATAVWETALSTTWQGSPVWVHGDVAAGNLLADGGQLSAVIDFGSSAVGDPACDLTIAWTLLSHEGREAFRSALPLDSGAWARARGWAVWKALITFVKHRGTNPVEAAKARHVIIEVVSDHKHSN
ncbi:MAG: aminoglycoside phosphotransferase family protein [Nitrososphaerales archaeon]